MGNNKKKGMLTRNDKMTTNDNMGVKKRHQNTKNMLDTNIFFSSNRGHEMLRVEGIGHNVGGYQEIHRSHYKH